MKSATMPFWLRSIAASSVRSFGIVLLRLAERVDRVLVIALRLQRLAETAPRVRIAELEVGPRATQLGGAPPVARLQHSRPFDLEYRRTRVPVGELRRELRVDGPGGLDFRPSARVWAPVRERRI